MLRSFYDSPEKKVNSVSKWRGTCPNCSKSIGDLSWPGTDLVCQHCSERFESLNGVIRLVNTNRLKHFENFLADYNRIRHAEGRGSHKPDYYLRLPEMEATEPLAWQWKIRNISYQKLLSYIFSENGRPMKIVDLGAGVGWLSYRLATFGHHPLAIDLNIDSLDGLAASNHYGGTWPRVQAEFDNLPIENDQADMIIFNASFHYSTDYRMTINECLRVLRKGGQIIIMDSPVYKKEASGNLMKREMHKNFEERYGTRSDSIDSIEYLTWNVLKSLGLEFGLKWRVIKPWYGWQRALRPFAAKIRGGREPSQFALLIGTNVNGGNPYINMGLGVIDRDDR